MKELEENPCLIFLYPDGEVWFDLTEDVKRNNIYRIRLELGGNKGIHCIYLHG